MNQRRETRLQTNQPVQITVFGQPEIRLQARIQNVSGRGLGLELERPLKTGSALKIELEDAILLGEVIYCRDQGTSHYVGVELEHALWGLAELATALRSFDEEYLGPQPEDAVHNARNKHH